MAAFEDSCWRRLCSLIVLVFAQCGLQAERICCCCSCFASSSWRSVGVGSGAPRWFAARPSQVPSRGCARLIGARSGSRERQQVEPANRALDYCSLVRLVFIQVQTRADIYVRLSLACKQLARRSQVNKWHLEICLSSGSLVRARHLQTS